MPRPKPRRHQQEAEPTEAERDALVARLLQRLESALPAAMDQSNAISVFLNERGIPPSFENTLALLMLACGNAHHSSRMTSGMLELMVGIVWEMLDNQLVNTVEAPPVSAIKS